jgi:PKD repeat protein
MDTISILYQGTAYTQGGFIVGTYDCNGASIYTTVSFNPNSFNMQANFSICDSFPAVTCDAYFYTYPDSMPSQFAYYFVDNSSGNPTSWTWDFGDGSSGTGQYPVHNYASNGMYNVCLTIYGDSCQDSYCSWITVGPDTTNTGCQAYFYTYSDSTNGYLDSTIYFVDASSGNPTNWYWDFGDGTNSSLQNPTHTYQSYGTYTVCLSIWDSVCQNTYCSTIVIGTYDSTGCYAYFGAYFLSSDSVHFVDYSSTNDPADSTITSWTWSFGDGTSSTGQNPVHVFSPGQYYVCLAITTASGCSSTYCDYVNVWSNDSIFCDLYVTASSIVNESATGAADGAISIDIYGGTSPYSIQWSNGDTTKNITGLTQGYYDVIITDIQGCETWATFQILDLSDSSNWGNYDTLFTNPLDTCFNFPIGNAYIYSYTIINNSTLAITWIVYDPQGINHSFVTVLYTFPSNGNYQAPLTIICDSVKSTYNFYDEIHILNQASDIISFSSENEDLDMFPNPVTDKLNIVLNSSLSGEISINIISVTGQIIHAEKIIGEVKDETISINTSSLPKGLYIVHLNSKSKTLTGRFIK